MRASNIYSMNMRTALIIKKEHKASLTVEAALIMPVFIYFILAFLYFIQLFIVQEQIQDAITRMGMDISKAAYVYQEFPTAEDSLSFDFSVFYNEFELKPGRLVDEMAGAALLNFYAREFLDNSQINSSCIVGGFDGLSFSGSDIFGNEADIDIVVSYRVRFPIRLFVIDEMKMVQRVRLRKWTGYKLSPLYGPNKEDLAEDTVYITESGSVYHTNINCSHIKLSIRAVMGIPDDLRNNSGGKYYPCELCCGDEPDNNATYYISSYGSKFHTTRECSRIKRTVREVKLSELDGRPACKRCSK
ncbi:MAG: pilus assembly protein [Clostridiales bacterium]|nr:pilus assembly protein [Clostridiales bacterium]